MNRIAIFPGSFDPFTIGHKDIVDRALALFDKIIIAIGVNERKQNMQSAEQRAEIIRAIYRDEEKIDVQQYSCLTADFAARLNASFIIKGVRSVKDFEYEREQAEINKMLNPELETVILFSSPTLGSISSSLVRELKHFGQDIDAFLPKS